MLNLATLAGLNPIKVRKKSGAHLVADPVQWPPGGGNPVDTNSGNLVNPIMRVTKNMTRHLAIFLYSKGIRDHRAVKAKQPPAWEQFAVGIRTSGPDPSLTRHKKKIKKCSWS